MATIKLNKNNLYYNLNQLSLKCGNKDKIAAVLKDNAYGHGIDIIANLVSKYGIKEAVVVNNQEALKIKNLFKNILILNDKPIKSNNFSYAINSLEDLKDIPKWVKIELKVDTGMHRNGICIKEIPIAIDIIKRRGLNLFGIFTHFRSADVLSSELFWQREKFKDVKRAFLNSGFKPRFHSHNSAATLRSKNYIDNESIARVGIAMYGYNELPSQFEEIKLKPVLSLYANRISTRELKRGDRVGYGGDFIANDDMVVSTYDVGYGSGLFRGDSKKPLFTCEGLPIIGRVSMDSIIVASIKDEICIFNDAKRVAKHFNTISYEITTRLNPFIKREIV